MQTSFQISTINQRNQIVIVIIERAKLKQDNRNIVCSLQYNWTLAAIVSFSAERWMSRSTIEHYLEFGLCEWGHRNPASKFREVILIFQVYYISFDDGNWQLVVAVFAACNCGIGRGHKMEGAAGHYWIHAVACWTTRSRILWWKVERTLHDVVSWSRVCNSWGCHSQSEEIGAKIWGRMGRKYSYSESCGDVKRSELPS